MAQPNDWLLQHRNNVTSQKGEDGVIAKVLEVIGPTNKWCVEFGAGDGLEFSNTWDLINTHGWSSVQIEAEVPRHELLTARYKNNSKVVCLNRMVSFEGESSLDNILAEAKVPRDLDVISIDVDGTDYHIWKSLQVYRPRLVVIEFNPSMPNDIGFVQKADMSVHHGNSLSAITALGKEKGYELVCATDFNAFYVERENFARFGIADNSLAELYKNVNYQTRFFQLYDGTIALAGVRKLLWHDIEIDHERLQVLPRELRKFLNYLPIKDS